jgi:ParB/RepB/Spo0J family partition protein
MKTQTNFISIEQIELIDKFNPRQEENYQSEELDDTIEEHGILVPLLVVESNKELSDGRKVYKLFDGYRRYKSAKSVIDKKKINIDIPVRVYEMMGEDELLMLALILGNTSKNLTTSEKAKAIIKLQNFGFNNETIAKHMKITVPNVINLKKFDKLTKRVQNLIDENYISFSEAVKLLDRTNNTKLIEKVINETLINKSGKITNKDIQKIVENSQDDEIIKYKNLLNGDLDVKNTVFIDNNTDYIDDELSTEKDELNNSITYKELIELPQNNIVENKNLEEKQNKNTTSTKETRKTLDSLIKYFSTPNIIEILNLDIEKVKLLHKIVEYQNGKIDIDELVDYFIIN